MFDTEVEKWGIVLPSGPYPMCGRKVDKEKDITCKGTIVPRTKPTPYSSGGNNNFIDPEHPTVFWKCNICGAET